MNHLNCPKECKECERNRLEKEAEKAKKKQEETSCAMRDVQKCRPTVEHIEAQLCRVRKM